MWDPKYRIHWQPTVSRWWSFRLNASCAPRRAVTDDAHATLSTPVAAFSCDENSTGAIGAVRVHPIGSNLEISQEPSTFVSVIRTPLGVFRGSRLSLLVVVSLRNTRTTAKCGRSY